MIPAAGEVNTARAPQVAAPGEIKQLGFLTVKTLHADPGRADVAVLSQIEGERILVRIAAEAGDGFIVFVIDRRLVVKGEVAKAAVATRVLGGEAKLAGAVLVTPVDLPALVTAHAALRVRGIHHAKLAEFYHRPRPAQRQLLRPFRVPLQRQPVRHPVAIRAAACCRTVVKILDTVITPQAAQGHGTVAQPLFKQVAGDVERERGAHLSPQRIRRDQHRIPGAVDIGQIGQGEGARLKLG